MFIELAKKLRDADSNLSLVLRVDGTLFSLGIHNLKEDVTYYSFSSTNLIEVYYRVNQYINCLTNKDKMNNFVDEIEKGNWEVVNV